MTTYHLLHRADRVDDLLDPSTWVSDVWTDEPALSRCKSCNGTGRDGYYDDEGEIVETDCSDCRGRGMIAERPRRGVSACRTLGQLRSYLRDRDPDLTGAVVVEIEADEAEDEDLDAAYGAVLVYPRRIVSVLPVTETPLADLLPEDEEDGMTTIDPDRLYEVAEVAEMLGIQRRSLLRRVRRGRWPSADRRIGGRPAWLGSTVMAAVETRGAPAR